jgi:hypothetical protein
MKSVIIPFTMLLLASLFTLPALAQEPVSEPQKPRKSSGRFPSDVAGLEEMAQASIEEENWIRLLQTTILLRKQQPYELRHFVNMVIASAMLERPTAAYHYMLQMQQQGLSYDFNQLDETVSLRGTEVYDYLSDLLIRAGDPAGEAEAAFELAPDQALPTALAWDSTREKFLVGTAREGVILAVDEKSDSTEILRANEENGLWAVMDVAVDADRNRLWISSAAIPQFTGFKAQDLGKSGLFAFELDSLRLVGTYLPDEVNAPFEFGSIAISPDGDVFVADRQVPVVYRKPADSHVIAPFLADKELNGFRDMAISEQGARLYLADSARGILVIDPENETAVMLDGPETLNLGGIEGMFQVGSELILIQSGIEPQRVLALQLDPSGGTVQEVRPMAIALEWFDRPSGGTLHGEAVYYFANTPSLEQDVTEREVLVLRTDLDAGENIVRPDMKKFEEETLSKARNN